MPTTLKQIQSQKQKLAPRQVLQARLLQLNTVNLEQAIIKELEQNPLLEQVEPEGSQENQDTADEASIDEIDVSIEDKNFKCDVIEKPFFDPKKQITSKSLK